MLNWQTDRKVLNRLRIERLQGRWALCDSRYSYPAPPALEKGSFTGMAAHLNELRAAAGLVRREFTAPDLTPRPRHFPGLVWHGTSLTATENIRLEGLQPRRGAFLRSSHGEGVALICAGTTRDPYRILAAMFAAAPEIETDSDFFARTALIALKDDGRWFQAVGPAEHPSGTEHGDWYRMDPIAAHRILSGDDLRRWFERHMGGKPSDHIDFITADREEAPVAQIGGPSLA